ncbi:MAG TPA: transporter, partial [Bacteroides sp.]|nr:transporter [Bacteroides sp.]
MDWIKDIILEHSALQALIVISLLSAIGLMLGRIRVWGVSLGVTFVFFVGILAGHLGISVDADMLNYAESFGLVLFVYALGLQVGPGFFSSFRTGGLRLNLLGAGVVLLGTLVAIGLCYLTPISMSDMVGILCGATTNTPALGAAQQALKQLGLDSSGAALGCAVTYPLGVVGVILALIVVRKLWIRSTDDNASSSESQDHTFIATYQVHNPGIIGKNLKEIAAHAGHRFVVSRLWRNGNVSIPTFDTELHEGDRLLVITNDKDAPSLTMLFGEQEQTDWNKEDIDWNA